MRLEVRGLKGKELRILQDKAAQKNGTFVDRILNACTESVVDPGPYSPKDTADGKIVWDSVLLGDKFFTLIAVRSATFGPEYSFKSQCGECRHRFEWALDLDALPVKPLASEDAASFRAGESLVATLKDGRSVKFRLPLGKDEREAARNKTAENALVAMMSLRIVELDGSTDRSKIRAYLEDASLSDLTSILKEFDRRDCGIETEIEVECDECGAIREVALPLDRGFWLPISA